MITEHFNLSLYRSLICNGLSTGYCFITFSELCCQKPKSKVCLLRHDLDADLSAAHAMAKVEKEIGVSATYFIMLRSPMYNLMARHNHQFIEKILSLGHEIGLHYDQGFDQQRGFSSEKTAETINREAFWLEKQFQTNITAVSFHQPGPSVLNGEISSGHRINTYDRNRLADFEYFSDSNREFTFPKVVGKEVSNAFSAFAPSNLQLLIHPMWWVYDEQTTCGVWDRAILTNLDLMQQQLIATERAFGPARSYEIKPGND